MIKKENDVIKKKFIEQATKIHGTKYDYQHVKLETTLDKINIICDVHGLFEIRAIVVNMSINNSSY